MRFDSAHLGLVINDGFMAATLHRLEMYGGEGRGRLELDAREADVRIVQEMTVDGVDAKSFLTDAANLTAIEGRMELSLSLRAVGRSQSDFTSSADGRAHIEVVGGALNGVDLGGISSTIQNALSGELISPQARTPFSGFSATFALSDGVLGSDSLSFNTPDLAIRGLGVFDLNTQRMDVRLAPRSPRGGIVFPFSARGPFAELAFNSDVRGLAQREIQANVRAVQAASRAAQ
jgi:AsmA protein